MIVRESISFERGKDPKKSMEIGKYNLPERIKILEIIYNVGLISTDNSASTLASNYTWIDYKELRRMDASGVPYKLAHGSTHLKKGDILYRDLVDHNGYVEYISTKNSEIYGLDREDIAKFLKMGWIERVDVNESINFERGKNPKKSMGLGLRKTKDNTHLKIWRYGDRLFNASAVYNQGVYWVLSEHPDSDPFREILIMSDVPNHDNIDEELEGYIWKHINKNESLNYNESDILTIKDLAEISARTQTSGMKAVAEKVFLKFFENTLEKKGDGGVIKAFLKATDLKLKTIIRGKYIIVYDE